MKKIFGLFLTAITFSSISASAADFTVELVPAPGSVQYGDVAGKPSTFTPSAHTHTISEVTNLQSELNTKATSASLSSYVAKSEIIIPKVTKLSGSGTFSLTGTPKYIRVRMIGGGGGGAGSTPASSASAIHNGANGTSSTFGSLVAGGGGPGTPGSVGNAGGVPNLGGNVGIGTKGNAGGPGGTSRTRISIFLYVRWPRSSRTFWRRRCCWKWNC